MQKILVLVPTPQNTNPATNQPRDKNVKVKSGNMRGDSVALFLSF